MKRQLLFTFLIWTGGVFFSFAQNTLTLKECIDLAVENSYRLQAENYSINAVDKNAEIENSFSVPAVSGGLATENRFLKPYNFGQVWAYVNADWSLGDFFLERGAAARQNVETERLLREQTRLNTVGKTSAIYMAILLLDKQKEIYETRLNFLKKHYDLTQSLWKAGIRTQIDVLQTSSEIVKLQQDTVNLAANRESLKVELARITGLKNAGDLSIERFSMEKIVNETFPFADTLQIENNPLILAYNSKIEEQNLRIKESSSQQYPHLFAGGGYVSDADPTGDGNYWRVNTGIAVPLYYGDRLKHNKELSKIKREELIWQKKDVRRQLTVKLEQITTKLNRLKDLISLQEKQLKIAKNTLELSEINYKAGLITNLEFLVAQNSYVTIRLSIEKSRLDYVMKLIAFYVITNRIDDIEKLGTVH
jgi:outer membrane protein TolC